MNFLTKFVKIAFYRQQRFLITSIVISRPTALGITESHFDDNKYTFLMASTQVH